MYGKSEKNAKDMAERLIKHHIFYRTSSAINQFKMGMDDVAGFWQLVAANSTQFKTLFCHKCLSLNKEQFQSLFKINFSEEGSNKRSFEEETMYSWELFLQDMGIFKPRSRNSSPSLLGQTKSHPLVFPNALTSYFMRPRLE